MIRCQLASVAALATVIIATAALRASAQDTAQGRIIRTTLHRFPLTRPRVAILPLANGDVFVNETGGVRLLLLDSTLNLRRVVLDTSGASARRYSQGLMIPGPADTLFYFDYKASALVAVSPQGAITRVFGLPRPQDANLFQAINGAPSLDRAGNLVYALQRSRTPDSVATHYYEAHGAWPRDSTALARVSLTTQRVDTVAWIHSTVWVASSSGGPEVPGRQAEYAALLTFPLQTDRWAVLSDGTIAVVRDADYHVDIVSPNGRMNSMPPVAHQWRRLSDEEKQHVVDSLSNAVDIMNAAALKTPAKAVMLLLHPNLRDISDYPPVLRGDVPIVGTNDRIWLRMYTYPATTSGPVYEAVDRTGKLVDRVQLLPGCALVGASATVAYATIRDGADTFLVAFSLK